MPCGPLICTKRKTIKMLGQALQFDYDEREEAATNIYTDKPGDIKENNQSAGFQKKNTTSKRG